MSKYIIEIEDVPFSKVHIDSDGVQNINLYRAKGFNALVFDEHGLDTLTPLDKALSSELGETYHKGFKAGQNEVWKFIDKFGKFPYNDSFEVFGTSNIYELARIMPYSEALKKFDTYYEQQKADEIRVGDEVEAYSGRAIVFGTFTDTKGEKFCRYWYPSDDSFNKNKTENLKKTGRHFPQVEELIKAMKGEQRSCSTCKYVDGSDLSKCSDCLSSKGYNMWESKEGANK